MSIPVPETTLRQANERLQSALDEVRRLTTLLGKELHALEVHARERSGEVRGQYQSTEASRSYDDMADRISALIGTGR